MPGASSKGEDVDMVFSTAVVLEVLFIHEGKDIEECLKDPNNKKLMHLLNWTFHIGLERYGTVDCSDEVLGEGTMMDSFKCYSWPDDPPFVGFRHKFGQHTKAEKDTWKYGRCFVDTWSSLNCSDGFIGEQAEINDPGKFGWCSGIGLMNRGAVRSAMVWCVEDEDEEEDEE